MRGKYMLFTFFLFWMLAATAGCGKKEEAAEEFTEVYTDEEELEEKAEAGEEAPGEAYEETVNDTICVYVCGQVNDPGVYELPKDSRLFEALNRAGGMTKDAAEEYLNQAQPLFDGQQIYVPTKEEAENGLPPAVEAAEQAGSSAAEGEKVNLNQASKEELMGLTGIGEVKAESIIRYREEQGNFKSIEEIMEIDGIKDGVFQKIKDDITV